MFSELGMDVVSLSETLLHVSFALCFGFVLGIERERKKKPIDFRAYMIVAATTCIVALLAQELYDDYARVNDVVKIDFGTVISGVLTGIGFLGAGAIIKVEKDQVVGTATGASIWAAGGIGLCLGFGMYGLSMIAFLAVGCILLVGGLMSQRDPK